MGGSRSSRVSSGWRAISASRDGTTESSDTIIYATGYEIVYPFLPDEVFRVENNEVALYRYIVPPDLPNLYFLD
ncbi:MAG: hypothetical protein U5R48_12325 [Gammaproteobacteria bacterium]|nr:hypothetical protein [Gammaproteobacteria bacterium]